MTAKEERNKALVLEAMTSLFQRKDPLSVERLYVANFIHHDPDLRQGRQVLAKIVASLPSAVSYEPGLIVAEGDYVALHGRIRGWAPRTQIVTDILRIEDGKLAEHWTVRQSEILAECARSKVAMFSPDEAARQMAPGDAASQTASDYDDLMQANLTRVYSECDADVRTMAICELYTEDAVLYEPHAAVTGHAAISEAAAALLAGLPHDFSFRAECAAPGHHGVGHLRWRSGPPNCPAAVTGADIARIEGGRIRSLHIFVDSAAISD